MLAINTPAPDFNAIDQDNNPITLHDLIGKYVLIYFYPKDDTPGCTTEACSIRDHFEELQKYARVIGVSADSVESHKKFIEKYQIPFTLLADQDKKIISAYGAEGIFGKRISYIIDPHGMIVKSYPKVNPSQHAEEILSDLKSLSEEK